MYTPRYFHVYNRGLDKRMIFLSDTYYSRFLTTFSLARLKNAPNSTNYFKLEMLNSLPHSDDDAEAAWGPSIVDVLCYCLMPNHFHFVLKEKELGGMTKFMKRVGDGFTKYFNTRQEREGRLFTGSYKFVEIKNDEQLIHVTRYVHTNPSSSPFTNISLANLSDYPWSSLQHYILNKKDLLCQPEEVISFFGTPENYLKFVFENQEESLRKFPKELFLDID